MYPGISKDGKQGGFSLLEMLVAIAVSGILLLIVVRFYKDSYRNYSLQEQIADRNQNAYFTIKHLTELMQQAGSGLPDSGYAVIMPAAGSPPHASVVIGTNPRGGSQVISQKVTSVTKIAVDDTTSFGYATDVLVDYLNPATATVKKSISSFIAGPPNAPDTIVLGSAVTLDTGDVLYAYKQDTIALSGTDLTIGGTVLAENVDTLEFRFYKTDKTAATTWGTMRSANIKVSARTPRADTRITGDQYRHLTLKMGVLFRNKI